MTHGDCGTVVNGRRISCSACSPGTHSLEQCEDCGHNAHETWGCSDHTCGCETMWTLEQADAQLAEDERQWRVVDTRSDDKIDGLRYVGIGPRYGI